MDFLIEVTLLLNFVQNSVLPMFIEGIQRTKSSQRESCWVAGQTLNISVLLNDVTVAHNFRQAHKYSGCLWQKYRCLNSRHVPLEEQWGVYGYGLSPYTGQIIVSAWVVSLEQLKEDFVSFLCSSHQSKGLQGALLQESLKLSGHFGAFPFPSR